jgi:hypothetical protein
MRLCPDHESALEQAGATSRLTGVQLRLLPRLPCISRFAARATWLTSEKHTEEVTGPHRQERRRDRRRPSTREQAPLAGVGTVFAAFRIGATTLGERVDDASRELLGSAQGRRRTFFGRIDYVLDA